MIKLNKPENLNGEELVQELLNAGIEVNTETSPLVDGNNDLWLDIDVNDESKAIKIVANHNGTTIVPNLAVKRQALLAKLGITEEEAKLLLS